MGEPQYLVPRQVAREQSTGPEEAVSRWKEAVAAFGRGGRVGRRRRGCVGGCRAVGLGRLAGVVGGGAGRVPVRPGIQAWFLGWLEQQLSVF